jgi:hypothetical protein
LVLVRGVEAAPGESVAANERMSMPDSVQIMQGLDDTNAEIGFIDAM